MKKQKSNKFLSGILTFAMIFLNTYVFAVDNGGPVDDILKGITEVLLVIAGLVCVGKLIQIGIMYLTSSAVEKSNAKSAVLPWLIGTIVCFSAATIGKVIIGILEVDKNVLSY